MEIKLLAASIVAVCGLGVCAYVLRGESPAPASMFVLLDGGKKHNTDFIESVTSVNFFVPVALRV